MTDKYPFPQKLVGYSLYNKEWVLSAIRGFRNGIICGARIRTPYAIQAIIYAVLYRDDFTVNKLRFVLKQMFHHGRNLGLFVFIYKTICFIMRHFGVRNGVECWVAGGIGGYYAFGESKGISGAVNNQIVLYLFARGVEGMLTVWARNGYIPRNMDMRTEKGFRLFAGFSLALILYMTDYQGHILKKGFMGTMDNLYYESNSGGLLSMPRNYSPFVLIVTISLLSYFSPSFSLDNLLTVFDRIGPYQRRKK